MDRQLTGSISALRRRRLSRAGLATALFTGVASASTAAGLAQAWITLVLPIRVTIALASGMSISGVRLTALGPTEVSYEKGGRRTLPAQEVKNISFTGPMSLESPSKYVLHGPSSSRLWLSSMGCQKPRQLLIPRTALVVIPNGNALALDTASISSTERNVLLNAKWSGYSLVVKTLKFEADGLMQLEYTCTL